MFMSEDVKYQNGIVTFMDLLGFRSLLRDKSPQELSRIMNIFISEGNPREGYDSDFDSMFTYAAISDCFFRAANTEHEINQKHPTGHFYHEIMDIVFIQCHLLMEGYLLRGAMTYGQYYGQHGENGAIVFGPAISRAYELESSHALHPRVIVDPYLIAMDYDITDDNRYTGTIIIVIIYFCITLPILFYRINNLKN